MRIGDVIERLHDLKEAHGDIDVIVYSDGERSLLDDVDMRMIDGKEMICIYLMD